MNFSVILVTLPDIMQLCSWYIFCTVDGLSLAVVGYSAGFFCAFDSLFAVAIIIAFLFFCVVPVLGAGGARGVMVSIVGNGHGNTSSNPGRD